RPGVHVGPGAGLVEGLAAGLVVDRFGLVDPEARPVDVVGPAGDQRVEHLAQLADVAHLEADGVAGAVAADPRLFVLDVAVGGMDVDAGGLDVAVGHAGGADGRHHLFHPRGVLAHGGVRVGRLRDHAGGGGGDVGGAAGLAAGGHRQQGAVGAGLYGG